MTLVELVVALAVTAVLVTAIASAIVLAAKAIPAGDDAIVLRIATGQVVEDMAGELQTAVSVASGTSTAVEFNVPDRDGDGDEETIRYEWSGQAGAPLRRTYNGGTTTDVVDAVQEFQLTYMTKAEPQQTELTSVAVMVNASTRSETRVRTRALTLNYPIKGDL